MSTVTAGTVTTGTATSAPRAWQAVLSHVEARLLAGDLAPGDHLPPERALSVELGVGRSSVREALRVLEVLGLIRTGTGSGPASGAIIVARPSGGMSALMRLQVAGGGFAAADVVATRLVLESAVVTALAERSPIGPGGGAAAPDQSAELPDDLVAARELLDAMDSATSADDFLALDAAFHLALAVASGNSVIAAMMAGLRHSIEGYVRAGAARVPSWSGTSARLREEHREILTAIVAGDPPLARLRMHDHIAGYYAETAFSPAPPSPPRPGQPAQPARSAPPEPSAAT